MSLPGRAEQDRSDEASDCARPTNRSLNSFLPEEWRENQIADPAVPSFRRAPDIVDPRGHG
jgi:hypothetical protein